LVRKSQSKVEVYAEVPLQLIPEKRVSVGKTSSGNVSLERWKQEAEKPLYLRRI
jgi:hypothetical protein